MLPLLEEAEATLGNDELEIEKRPAPVPGKQHESPEPVIPGLAAARVAEGGA